MNSARPAKTHSVPLRPGGGAKRAKRKSAPSAVFTVPTVAPSGTGFAGIEINCMGACDSRLIAGEWGSQWAGSPPLDGRNRRSHMKPAQAIRLRKFLVRPLGADRLHVALWRICHANFRSCPPLSFPRRLRPPVLDARWRRL